MEPRLCAPGLPVPRLGVVEFGLPCLLVLASRVDAAGVGKVALAKANTGLVCPLCGCELVGDSGSSIFAGVAGATCFLEGVVEEKIVGREVTVGIVDGEALPVVEIRPKTGAYDYTNKYTTGATEYICPAKFDEATTLRIQTAAGQALTAVGGGSYARVDFIVRDCGEPVLLEVNTLPGMTETSLLPKAAKAAGMSFVELCQRLVDLALEPAGQMAQPEPI